MGRPLGSAMFAPGTAHVMSEFKTSNPELASFVVSVYLLGYAFGPLIIGPLSELYGRMYLYHACNILFIVFNIACALAPSLASLIVFRFLAGSAGSCPLTIGAASLADMIKQEKRGAAMGAWALGPLIGPVVGPIAGGYLTEAMGWRWTFWILAIAVSTPFLPWSSRALLLTASPQSGAVTINTFLFMSESCHPILLERKRKRLVKETGNQNLKSVLDTGKTSKELFLFAIVRPTKMLFLSPIVLLLSLFMALVYGYLYLLFTTFTNVFVQQYHFSTGIILRIPNPPEDLQCTLNQLTSLLKKNRKCWTFIPRYWCGVNSRPCRQRNIIRPHPSKPSKKEQRRDEA